ncbi:MAG TPA: PocR ligand-binding domain-containing protein, partial [Clostridia bacterium]|nr:PocR ligand-binding domain-containing protein [Clostridia bacterium]
MLEKQSVEKVIQIFHHSTELPILSIDCQQLISFKMMKDIESSTVMNYLEWQEALDFLKTISANSGCIRQNYTYYTTNGFIYSIIPLEMKQNDFEALISGPFLSTHPHENQIEAMARQYHFNENQKLRFRSILNNLPLASRERMDYLGRLLLALLKAEEQSSSIQTVPEDHLPNKIKIIKTLCET